MTGGTMIDDQRFEPVECDRGGSVCAGHSRHVGGGIMDGTVTHLRPGQLGELPATMGTTLKAGARSHYRRDDAASPSATDVVYRFVGLAVEYPGDPADHEAGPPPGASA